MQTRTFPHYLVQGSVRQTGPRVRISVQLVETAGGRQIWAEQYDRQLQEMFELQDEIASTVAARIEPEIGNAEHQQAERKPPQTFEAWDFFRLGTKRFYESTAAGNREAQRLFRRAIELDPTLAQAYGFLSYAIVLSMVYFDVKPDNGLLDESVAIAKQATALDERDALIRFMYGRALLASKSYDDAIVEPEVAAEFNPNLAVVHCGFGDTLAYKGRVHEAIPHFERAINLSTHDPFRWAFCSYRALAHLFAQDSNGRGSPRAFRIATIWASPTASPRWDICSGPMIWPSPSPSCGSTIRGSTARLPASVFSMSRTPPKSRSTSTVCATPACLKLS